MSEQDTAIGVLPFYHIYGLSVILGLGLASRGQVLGAAAGGSRGCNAANGVSDIEGINEVEHQGLIP